MQQLNKPKAQMRQTLSWIGQAVSGILLIVILFLHMLFQHFSEGLLSAGQVLQHMASPAIFALEILFIIVVTYHALLGVRAIIFDLKLTGATRRRITAGITILGVITIIYGVVLAILITSQSVV
jgi:succinate dehydrogenase hydrophobic anchor subunit